MQLNLPTKAVRDWAIKDLVSRESIPDDADDLQLAAGIRRQAETMRTYAQHALRLYAKSVDVRPCDITDEERTSAAVAITKLAAEMRQDLRDGTPVLTDVPIPRPTANQLMADDSVLHVLQFHTLDLRH